MRRLKLTAISVATVDGMVDHNHARALRLTEIALRDKPDIVLLPEAFACGYCGTNLAPFAETMDSPHIVDFRELSRSGNCLVVFGFLLHCKDGIQNVTVLFDQGHNVGIHCKSSLWHSPEIPHRDVVSLIRPGNGIEVFETRLGRCAVLICYENMLEANWGQVAHKVDFILSPYNCESDVGEDWWNIRWAKRFGTPSAWANRTGTVYMGDHYQSNLGSAGLVDGSGRVLIRSQAGVEQIVTRELPV